MSSRCATRSGVAPTLQRSHAWPVRVEADSFFLTLLLKSSELWCSVLGCFGVPPGVAPEGGGRFAGIICARASGSSSAVVEDGRCRIRVEDAARPGWGSLRS